MVLHNNFFKISKLLIIIFPFLLVSGPFFSDLACLIIGLTFFLYCCKINNFSEYKNYIVYFFLFIYIYLNINSFFSFSPKISFQTSLSYIRIILFIVALSFFFNKYKKIKYYLLYSFLFCLFLICIDSLFQLYTGYNFVGFKIQNERVSSFFGDKLILGSYVSRLLPFFIALTFVIKSKKNDFLILYLLLISAFLIIISNERTAMVYYIFTIIFYFFLNYDKKVFNKYIFFLIVTILILIFFKPNIFNRVLKHTLHQYNETKSFFALSYRHQTHFQTAYSMFLDKKLLGHGLKSFRNICNHPKYSGTEKIILENTFYAKKSGVFSLTLEEIYNNDLMSYYSIWDNNEKTKYKFKYHEHLIRYAENNEYVQEGQKLFANVPYLNGCNTHPHNIYLQFLSELGLLGFLFFMIIFIYILYQLIYFIVLNLKKKITDIHKCKCFVLFGVFLSMIPVLPSGNYFNNWLLIITYLPIGFYLSLSKFGKRSKFSK
jgi:O-antigen ligase